MANTYRDKNHIVELLSPAGDIDCFKAAINAGADAVYLALDRFGARANARNLSSEELKCALEIAHITGKKIYLTVNTLFKDDEIAGLYDFLKEPYRLGLHGVIVQDVGVMSYIHRYFPDLPIHVSTQAAVTSSDGCALLKDLGVTRVVPARELSLDEIKKLRKESGLEIECFIHGSLCYSYSGKCLLSSFIGGRSGNRGRCAQPCRLMYDDSYPLSLKDLCTVDMIGKLIDAGISSFKIEGRMKSAEYVYGVTSIYRKYIDRYIESGSDSVDSADMKKLISYYTRSGNCSGYYFRHNDRGMITPESPSYESVSDVFDIKEITRIPTAAVNISCTIEAGKAANICVYNDDHSITADTSVIPDKAENHSLTKDSVTCQLKKSGGTSFDIENIELKLDDGLFLQKSALNTIRREGLDAFADEIISSHLRILPEKPAETGYSGEKPYESVKPLVNVSVMTSEQLKTVSKSKADGIIVPMSLFLQNRDRLVAELNDKDLYIALPYVVREESGANSRDGVIGTLNDIESKYNVKGYHVSNLESVRILKNAGFKGLITGDIYLYSSNRYAYDFLKGTGVDKLTVPVELNSGELLRRGITGEELIIYGRLPVMVSANCIFNTKMGCDKKNTGHSMYLRDRKGEKLFVYCNCAECTNVIFNSAVLSISDEENLIKKLAPSSLRLSFTDESASEAEEILGRYFSAADEKGFTSIKLIDKYTKGHLKRGVD